MPPSHLLDRPIWSALTTRQAHLAETGGKVRRYPADIAPFADMEDVSPESFAALHAMMRSGEPAVMFTPDPVTPPPEFETVMAATGEQMIGTPADAACSEPLAVLGDEDAAAMRELVALTNPGPFGPRTHLLGRFLGIRVDGRLVAMTGERMAPGPYTEMTAVCVHPDFRGRGFAQALLAAVSRGILDRGEIPFLHVFSENAPAIALYKRQGMTTRRRLHVTALGRMGDNLGEGLKHKLPH
ncbi:MAG: GNAT family N-acetyltransferase [Alphaproteobacteria bacterium]|nr:GNAT family N-acetyltransferase [Alphaproteobacteria bacterium]